MVRVRVAAERGKGYCIVVVPCRTESRCSMTWSAHDEFTVKHRDGQVRRTSTIRNELKKNIEAGLKGPLGEQTRKFKRAGE